MEHYEGTGSVWEHGNKLDDVEYVLDSWQKQVEVKGFGESKTTKQGLKAGAGRIIFSNPSAGFNAVGKGLLLRMDDKALQVPILYDGNKDAFTTTGSIEPIDE